MISEIIIVVSFIVVGSLVKGVINLRTQQLPVKYLRD
jgi:hypothetical protein